MLRLVRAFDRHVEVISLRLRELGQHAADFFQVQTRDFLGEGWGMSLLSPGGVRLQCGRERRHFHS